MNPPKSCMGSHLTGKSQEKQGNRGSSTEAAGVQQEGEQQLRMQFRNGRAGAPPETQRNQELMSKNGDNTDWFLKLFYLVFFF